MTVVKTSNVELRNEIIRKNGDLKSVRETAKAFEIASEGSKMMKNGEEVNSQDTGEPELKRVSTPGRFSMRNKGHRPGRLALSAGMRHISTRIHVQLLEGGASSVDV